MKQYIRLVFIILFSALFLILAGELKAQVQILPLGNSITEGDDATSPPVGDRVAYRFPLYTLLNSAAYNFNFIGHGSSGYNVFTEASHAGISGTRDQYVVRLLQDGYDLRNLIQITPDSKPYLDVYTPDIILLHVGTNDITDEASADPTQVSLILDEIDAWEAANGQTIVVFVARIINRNVYSLITNQFNDNVENMVNLRGDPNIIMVDMEDGAGIDYATEMLADGIHPSPSAYGKMAQTWFDALDPYLSSIPSAPTGLSANAIDANSIQLNWTENSANETGFRIERSLSPGSGYSEIDVVASNVTAYTDNGLNPGTTYYYRVYAYNTGGASVTYASGSTTTLANVPSAPTSLTFGTITNNSIQLNWNDNSSNEDGFEIFRSLSAGGPYTSVGTTAAGVATYNNTGLTSNTAYFYRVYAYNTGGASVTYASGSTTTLPNIPTAPTSLTFGTITNNSIQLNWNDNSSNEDGFEIFRSLSPGGPYTSVGTTAAGVATFTNTGLNAITRYYYRVGAYNAGGSSTYVSGNAITLPNAPAAPTNLTFGTINSSSIRLNWSDNSNNEDGFEIFRSLTSGGPFVSIATTGAGVTTYNNTGLTEDTQYFYRIYAYNSGGSSASYASGNATTLPDPPVTPGNLTFTNITTSLIRLNWTDNSDNEDGFEIKSSLSLGGPFTSVETTGPGITTFNHTGLNDDTEYFYQVMAFNTGGNSGILAGSATTLLKIPDNPSNLTATANNTCSVDLKWDDKSDNEDGFEIERSLSPTAGFVLIQTLGADIVTFRDTDTENNNTYYYRVRAFNASGPSGYTTVRSAAILVTLNGGAIGTNQAICPEGDPALLFNITSPSGGSNNWSYQWQSRFLTGLFQDVAGATALTYNPPAGLVATTEYQRVSTVECGSVVSNIVTVTLEDLEDPVFANCPEDQITAVDRDKTSISLPTLDPLVTDNCRIETLTWTLSGATTGVSPATGINYLRTHDFNLGVTTVTYRATDELGNFSLCSFDVTVEYKVPEIKNVTIPNASMKIGDIISATIKVSTDGGIVFSMVSGAIGGYPLYNFQRIDATTYLANFEITQDGNSYLAADNIPVTGLIISDGSIQSLPFNVPVSQGGDPLDSKVPVISSIVAVTGIYGIGDVVVLNISADGLNYSIHPSSLINGIQVTETNVTFTVLGGGNYRLSYVVQEGDNDVEPGELLASVILVKPSGNIGLPYTNISNTASVSIDAHPPVISQMEVPDMEVGVGGTVEVTITADEEGYVAAAGTTINGIPLSSPRVIFIDRMGGLYEIRYEVAAGDAEVAPGKLVISIVMTDPSGNANDPYIEVEPNSLEIYTDLPVALIAGTPEICEGETAELTVFLEGRKPWSFDLSDGTNTIPYNKVNSNVFNISVAPLVNTTYRIVQVRDVNGVVNAGSGSVPVKVNKKTKVEIINLASGYNYEADPVKLEANVPGGIFSGPGVFSETGYFDPGVADTLNSPHTIYYSYLNTNGCVSVDSAVVFVLGANGGLYIPSDLVCSNTKPFMAYASNVSGTTGSFVLLNAGGQPVDGLTDNGDNSAEIDPGQLTPGQYTIEYEYVDIIPLYLRRNFVVEAIALPVILNLDDSYCHNEEPVQLQSDNSDAVFEGPGVSGTTEDGFVFNPGEVNPGVATIQCIATSDHGCVALTEKTVTVLSSPNADFSVSVTCIPDTGGVVGFDNLTDGKLDVTTWRWNFGDPASGSANTSDLISPDHFYSTPGERTISLTAIASNGCVSEKTKEIVIGNQVSSDFTWLSDCYSNNSKVVFVDRSISGFSAIEALTWRFKTPGGALLDEIISNTGHDTISYQFSSAGNYVVELLANNILGCSDSTSSELYLRETIKLSAGEYAEPFDLDEGGWTMHSLDQEESWTWNVPDFDGFIPVSDDNAWFTQLPDDVIGYREDSWLQSPCFDFTGIKKPMISMDIMRSFVPERDGAVLQYQVNRDEGWKTIGEIASGIEWYNSSTISNEPGGSSKGWSLIVDNPDQDWVPVAHDLNALAQVPNATFRIALGSNGREGIGNQGFAFDNVTISQRTKMAVIEHFTNSADDASQGADDVIDAFVKENSGDVVDLQYHMNKPGTDPMNENNPLASSVRSFNYGIPKVPYAVLDGGSGEEYRYDFSELKSTPELDLVMQLALQEPAFDVDLQVNWMEGALEATTLVTCNTDRYDNNVQLYVVVFETSVTQYTGLNGDTEFRNVVLDMLPTPAGKLLGDNWRKGDDNLQVNTWTYKPYVENTEDLAVIAFVQDRNTSQILQASAKYLTPQVGIEGKHAPLEVESLFIYPNPAKSFVNVNLGRPAEHSGRFEIIDMNGRVVYNENVPAGYQIYQIEIEFLNRGFYMIQWYERGTLKGRNKLVTVD